VTDRDDNDTNVRSMYSILQNNWGCRCPIGHLYFKVAASNDVEYPLVSGSDWSRVDGVIVQEVVLEW
jgi:hypothetical protein